MCQCISSASTIWLKYVIPGLFIPAIGIQAVVLIIDPFKSTLAPDIRVDHAALARFWFALWVVFSVAVLWRTVPLKRVCIGDNELLVSNYFTEWRIPFDTVESVSQPFRVFGRRVNIRLRSDLGCGTTVRFAPTRLWFTPFWRVHPVVGELRRLAGMAAVKK